MFVFFGIWVIIPLILTKACVKESKLNMDLLKRGQLHDEAYFGFLETATKEHENINNIFLRTLPRNNLYYKAIKIKECSPNITETLDVLAAFNMRYVVNLYAENFYNTNYNDVLEYNFKWAGDIDNYNGYQEACKSNLAVKKDIDIKNETISAETCTVVWTKEKKYVKLVSQYLFDDENMQVLYNHIYQFNGNRTEKLVEYKVVVCNEKHQSFEINRYNYTIKFTNDPQCKVSDDVIIIIAPNTNLVEETSIPVIFYEEPRVFPSSKDAFRNSFMKVRSFVPLADAFYEYMIGNDWNRVAILSDDSEESEMFETKLKSLFNRQEVIYTIYKQESKKCCDFKEALTSLKQAQARIIIANVDERNSKHLARDASVLQMTMNENRIVWLARDWSVATTKEAAKTMNTVYTVLETPASAKPHIDTLKSEITKYKGDFLDQVSLAKFIRTKIKWSKTTLIDVIIVLSNGQMNLMARLVNGKVESLSQTNILDRPGGAQNCLLTSNNYYKPCNDMDLIYFMMVLMGFVITLLGVMCFFETPNIPYNRMCN